jgi:uncharacterized protein (DUF1501 family)
MRHCCNEFSRSALLRKAAAEAGAGLPPIEPGMPLPAGTGLDRRSFLARSVGLALAVYGGSALAPRAFDEGIAEALAAGGPNTVLVSIFMDGGADSLSLLFPHGDSEYRKLRPKLALPDSGRVFPEDPRLRWHPAAASFQALHTEGKLSVLPAVGYTNADQSHFTSRHYWEVGATDARLQTGWLGRYLDRVGAQDNPLQGVSLDGDLSPTLATTKNPVAALSGAADYSFWAPGVWGQVEERMLDAIGELGAARGSDSALAGARKVTLQSDRLRRQLEPFSSNFTSPVPYPQSEESDFPERMAGLAAMLAAGLPLHCVALSAYGAYDTHSEQADTLAQGVKLTSDTLLAFQHDLEARGLADRVLTLVWSEFGRRAEENGSDGTDHGAAGIGFLMGTRVRGTMIGEFPGLKNLDEDGNLKATVDFRSVYCSVLEQWLGTDAAPIVPRAKAFPRVQLLR